MALDRSDERVKKGKMTIKTKQGKKMEI